MLVVPSRPPAMAVASKVRNLRPAASAISHNNMPVSAAVLRLGCLRISRSRAPKMPSQSNFSSDLMRCQWANRLAACSTTKGLTSSDGWIWRGPITNQRLAPLTVLPMTRVAATSKQLSQRAGPASFSQRRRLVETARPSRLQLAAIHISCRLT